LKGAAMRIVYLLPVAVTLAGCAGLQFNPTPEPDALTYNEPIPYFQVIRNGDCTVSGAVVSLPGRARSVAFRNGYGTADLSVSLQNGILTSVNQKTDSKIPETLSAVASLAGVAKTAAVVKDAKTGAEKPACETSAKLYPIYDGVVDRAHPVTLSTL
jgi:hypothetical protein